MYKTVRNATMLGVGLGVSAVVGWLLLKETKREKDPDRVLIRSQNLPVEPDTIPEIVLPMDTLEAEDQPSAERVRLQENDLTLISGIGPRFAGALKSIGISHFKALAEQNPEELAQKLSSIVKVTPQRIRDNNWIGQAAQLAQE